MAQKCYKVRNGDGDVIGQFQTSTKPSKPDLWDGVWEVQEIDCNDLNSEKVDWWMEQPE